MVVHPRAAVTANFQTARDGEITVGSAMGLDFLSDHAP
jgi:hypothetical protein